MNLHALEKVRNLRDPDVLRGDSKSDTTAFMVRFLQDRLELRGDIKVSIKRKDALVFCPTNDYLTTFERAAAGEQMFSVISRLYLTHQAEN